MRVASWVYYGTLALLVVGLSAGLSAFVTRRVRRLARAAAAPLGPEGELPGPFPVSRDDEIGALARSMNGLRDRVSQLLGRLAERDVHRREWVAQVSHDLRTPLTALMACLDRADQALEDGSARGADGATGADGAAELRRTLQTARLDAERVCVLAEDLLEIARLEADDPLDTEPVPPGELLRATVRELEPLAERKGLRLEAEVAAGLPTTLADGRRLVRALENLVRNALDVAAARVVVSVSRDGADLRFAVRDDGPGLPEVDGRLELDALGRRPGQRPAHAPARGDSAGLGLRVTRRVAEAHGGGLGARNEPGGGATVWFTLPVREA